MPKIYDNIEFKLFNGLENTLKVSQRADFCVGYFNLRGWKLLDAYIEEWSGKSDECCRLMVGMQKIPHDELRETLSQLGGENEMDNQTAFRLKNILAEQFRQQLTMGSPTNEDEAGLKRLARQMREKKVIVKLYLRHTLHAKLYLLFRPDDPTTKIVGFLGSSNLTFSGLSGQGELNVDVLEQDACQKLAKWFEDRWNDGFCIDISEELAGIVEESWAREKMIPPYYIYLKMAYHLSQEARSGLSEFRIPDDFGDKLFEFQMAAVKVAAHHLNKRNGVLIGDVVGLGKTMMATALARIFEDDFGLETLILCPKNLVPMWKDYREEFRLRGKVLSVSKAIGNLEEIRRYRLVIIDESHNLRNREGKRYLAIQEYIKKNESKVILLSATPYNKTFFDLSNQLRLFLEEDYDLGIRPERLLRQIGILEFERQHQCMTRSVAAFEKSGYTDDWRDLMRLFLVRRTRSFIKDNYALTDPENGRKYLVYEDGKKAFFPDRIPKTIRFTIDENVSDDQYGRLYSDSVVEAINNMHLPRYGLGNYEAPSIQISATPNESRLLQNLSRAGNQLMGFCRVNLFKRLESSGSAFLQSIERHILRNFVFLHALENKLPLPLGTQDAVYLDPLVYDEDVDAKTGSLFENDENVEPESTPENQPMRTAADFKRRAAEVYTSYGTQHKNRFKWLRSEFFVEELREHLIEDSNALLSILQTCGDWQPAHDAKLKALFDLLSKNHKDEKVIVFSQFADTVRYLEEQLGQMGLHQLAGVTGDSENPTELAWRFSPVSNKKRNSITPEQELRVLVSTDVLSEGQNLQDCAIVVNYDLPWAIIRLIQRAGRVDRIGQQAEEIKCYSFIPAEGVERIINLRARVRRRLQENAEVVGADEAFFEEDMDNQTILYLYHEKTGILDGEQDKEVDLASQAYEIWKNATQANPDLKDIIPALPDVIYSSRDHKPESNRPEGVLVFLRTAENNDALAYIDKQGKSITESQFDILKMAECSLDTPAQPRHEKHHGLVEDALRHVAREEKRIGGHLGRPGSARHSTYTRLAKYVDDMEGSLFEARELKKILDQVYRYPLKQRAIDILNRQLKSGIHVTKLAELVTVLYQEDRLCLIESDGVLQEPRIICSLGLFEGDE